ncbi:MAG TPA: sterol desaturase family protein [Lutibacter sp.]|nr:sterol desaturase family protein [Lutibacter sp.]
MENNKALWIVMLVVLFIIGVEFIITRIKGIQRFRFQNTVVNLSMGIFDRIAGLLMLPFIYKYFEYLHTHFSLLDIPNGTIYFIIAVLFSDFLWYFYHMAGHRINLFWGAHIVHHQSEDYNYSVALNLTPFQVVVRVLVWSVMPIMGFSANVVLGTHLVIGLYQFLLHTSLIGKLGLFEEFMVTPSHHRVHHGSNEQYLDKNYGGIFIIWDRLFNTFEREEEEVSYGITKDINSRGFLTSVFHYYNNLLFQMKQLPSVQEKFLLFFKAPDWVPSSGALQLSNIYIEKGSYQYQKFSKTKIAYIVFSILFTLVLLSYTAFYLSELATFDTYLLSSIILFSIYIIGRLIENKKVLLLEIIKYLGIVYVFIIWNL